MCYNSFLLMQVDLGLLCVIIIDHLSIKKNCRSIAFGGTPFHEKKFKNTNAYRRQAQARFPTENGEEIRAQGLVATPEKRQT